MAGVGYLLDTHTVLWALIDSEHLSAQARAVLTDDDAPIFASAVSAYEIGLKHGLGRLPEGAPLAADYEGFVVRSGWSLLPLSSVHAMRAGLLPRIHRDPFDRMLAAQALSEEMTFLSNDERVDGFGVRRLW